MTEVQKEKEFKSTSKTFHLPPFVSVDLLATANENKYLFAKISGTTGFRPTIVLLRANQKSYMIKRDLPSVS